MIKIENASKQFNGKPAVVQLNLDVRNELYVFLGPNGAGKTTSIKMMTGLLTPDTGSIAINNIDLIKEPVSAKRKFGYVPEFPALHPKLTPQEFLDFIAHVYQIPAPLAKSRVKQLYDIFELVFENKLNEELSNGMKKKISIIAALLHEPSVLFLDEPTAALDPKAARYLKDILRGLVEKGVTIFMTTHILEIAESMADRIGIINHGALASSGTLQELKEQHPEDASLEDIFLKLTGKAETEKISKFLRG